MPTDKQLCSECQTKPVSYVAIMCKHCQLHFHCSSFEMCRSCAIESNKCKMCGKEL